MTLIALYIIMGFGIGVIFTSIVEIIASHFYHKEILQLTQVMLDEMHKIHDDSTKYT